ncbi:MAG: hypothetical protein ACTHM5_07185, partial [Ginsengibacter sp.]
PYLGIEISLLFFAVCFLEPLEAFCFCFILFYLSLDKTIIAPNIINNDIISNTHPALLKAWNLWIIGLVEGYWRN